MSKHAAQRGITLVVSLIMLIILTLLVVSAIRFGNINLKISGNAQTEAEASAATQVALEKVIGQINTTDKITDIPAQPEMVVSTGGATYKVNVKKPVCTLSQNIKVTALDPDNPKDKPCIEPITGPKIFDENGKPITTASTCRDQQWEVAASIGDTATGAQVSMLQGVAVRVSAEVDCP